MARSSANPTRWDAVQALALKLNACRVSEIPADEVPELAPHLDDLVEGGLLVRRDGSVRFFHDTVFDHVLARAFVDQGRSLIDEIRAQPQDLSRRPLLRRVLTFERGTDRAQYRESVASLLAASDVRFLLRDVAFDVMREDSDPEAPDWELLSPLVVDTSDENHQAAWNVAIQPAWLDVIDRTGTLLRWMASSAAADADRAASLLWHLQRHAPGRAAVLMAPFVDLGEAWQTRIRWVLSSGRAAEDKSLFELLRTMLADGAYDEAPDALWHAAYDLPAKQPRWGVQLLRDLLDRALIRSPEATPFGTVLPEHGHEGDLVRSLARRAPAPFAEAVLPFVIEIAESVRDQGPRAASHDPWTWRTFGRGHGFDDALYESLDESLRELAASKPRKLERLLAPLAEGSGLGSLRFLLYRAWAANAAEFWRPALRHLEQSPAPFECGYLDSPYWVTRELINEIQAKAPRSTLAQLEASILTFYSDWERSADGRRSRGVAQLTLLDAFADRKLSEAALGRRSELRRKFEKRGGEEPQGIRVSTVGSPIGVEAARKMSDASWLRAIRRYSSDEGTGPEFFKGGAVELSRVLEQQTKEEPERFANLSLRLPDDANEYYVDALLRGVGDADDHVPADLIFQVLRRFFAMPARPGGRWINKPLARVADQDVPQDVLDIAAWYATQDPNPEHDVWQRDAETGMQYYGGDPFSAGINSVRGAAAEALSVLIWPSQERLVHLTPALEHLVGDPVVAVRCCAAVTLRSVYRHDRQLAVDLFLRLRDADEALWATRPFEDFISIAARTHLGEMRPVLADMLRSDAAEVQSAGGRQSALAYLADSSAEDLLATALAGPSATRAGVAEVAAHNIAELDVRDTCVSWLERLFDDPDQDVREEASRWVRRVGPTGLRDLSELAAKFVASAAYRDDEFGLLHALDESTVPVVDTALVALKAFVDQRQHEIGDFQRRAALSAMTASKLAVRAYTSATSEESREDALDVIDALLAAKVSEIRTFVEAFDQAT